MYDKLDSWEFLEIKKAQEILVKILFWWSLLLKNSSGRGEVLVFPIVAF